MSEERILFSLSDEQRILYVRVIGKGTFEGAYQLSSFAEPFLERSYETVIDLSQTSYLDSTFLGIFTKFTTRGIRKSRIVNAGPDVTKFFDTLGITRLFETGELDLEGFEFRDLPETGAPDRNKLAEQIISAHMELLRNTPQQGGEKFRKLIEQLLACVE